MFLLLHWREAAQSTRTWHDYSWPWMSLTWLLFIIWQAPWAGKMNQIARCDWLPERARWSHLARSGLPAVSRKQTFTKSHIINPLLTKYVRSRWLHIGLVLFFASLWTSTSSRSINTQKKNLANIQPSWPHTWSITHTYWLQLWRHGRWFENSLYVILHILNGHNRMIFFFTNYFNGTPT